MEVVQNRIKIPIHADMSLMDISDAMEADERGITEYSEDELKTLGTLIRAKIDGYHDMLDVFITESERLDRRAKLFADGKKVVGNKHKRLKELLMFVMRKYKWNKLPGQDFIASRSVVEKNTIEFEHGNEKPTEQDWLKHPEAVNLSYTWDKKVLKNMLLSGGNDDLKKRMKLVDSERLSFRVNKGVK